MADARVFVEREVRIQVVDQPADGVVRQQRVAFAAAPFHHHPLAAHFGRGAQHGLSQITGKHGVKFDVGPALLPQRHHPTAQGAHRHVLLQRGIQQRLLRHLGEVQHLKLLVRRQRGAELHDHFRRVLLAEQSHYDRRVAFHAELGPHRGGAALQQFGAPSTLAHDAHAYRAAAAVKQEQSEPRHHHQRRAEQHQRPQRHQ